ncbi:MAG: hypothetical protein U9N82_11325 [Thermodesulfobacteriota bacterium]|nr:hypothetical protein [Thermodesulfobacteriota bacterium]
MLMYTQLIGFAALIFLFSLILRILPHLSKEVGGADCWFYLIYVRELKKNKKFPPKFHYFILDHPEQWYPPGFPLFLSLFPESLLQKWHWLISPIIDCLHGLIVYFFCYWFTGSLYASIAAGVSYAVVPTLYSENRNLNSRALSSLLFSANMLCLFLFVKSPSWTLAVPLLVSGFLVLMTHKMATQVMAFAYLFLGIHLWKAYVPLLFLVIMGLTFALSAGFYGKVLKAHFDILAFWRRHIDEVRAHQVFESHVYRDPNRKTDRLYLPGWRGVSKKIINLLAHNPLILMLPLFVKAGPDFFSGWLFAVIALILLTTFFSPMIFLGEGFKYIKYLAFPQSLFLGIYACSVKEILWANIVIAAFGLLSLGVMVYLHIYTNRESLGKVSGVDNSLKEILEVVRQLPGEKFLCLPTPIGEVLAYKTGKKVLSGGHGYGFNNLEGFFPVLQRPLEGFFKEYGIAYFLLDEEFVPVSHFSMDDSVLLKLTSSGKYSLYQVKL